MNKARIFVILPRVPYPLEKGDKLRAYHLIKGLHKDFNIHLFALHQGLIDQNIEDEISQICDSYTIVKTGWVRILWNSFINVFGRKPFQVAYFYHGKLKRKIDAAIKEEKPDLLFCQLLRTAEYAKGQTLSKILDYQDAFSKGMKRRAETSSPLIRWFYAIESRRLQRYEKKISQDFSETLIISEQDREAMPELAKKPTILRNGVDMNYYTPQQNEEKYDLLFVGNMSYAPNVNAVLYFAKQVMPILLQKYPRLQFVIAGANPHAKVKMLASDNIIITGWADDLREYYSRSKIFVAPMQIGTGLQNKLLEAMAMELPCVTSSLANNALGAEPDKEILIADSPEEYSGKIMLLLEDETLRTEMASLGRKLIQLNYSWEKQISTLKNIFIRYL
ncbi:MAG: glycosyltransferase [Bacteroidales bacterium]|nr:glycosyltransferase [Bacteroidales bacterium]